MSRPLPDRSIHPLSDLSTLGQQVPTISGALPDRSVNSLSSISPARQYALNFIDLPLEAKGFVYEYVLGANTHFYLTVAANDPAKTHSGANSNITYGLPAICFINNSGAIATQAFLRTTTLCLLWNTDAPLMIHWLRKISNTDKLNLDSVRRLDFNYVKRPYFNDRSEDSKLLQACTNLVYHTLTLTVEELNIRDNGKPGDPKLGAFKVRGITGEEFVANLSLAPLVDCARLRRLTVNVWTGYDGPLKASVAQVDFVKSILQCLKVEFEAKHARTIEIVLGWHKQR